MKTAALLLAGAGLTTEEIGELKVSELFDLEEEGGEENV